MKGKRFCYHWFWCFWQQIHLPCHLLRHCSFSVYILLHFWKFLYEATAFFFFHEYDIRWISFLPYGWVCRRDACVLKWNLTSWRRQEFRSWCSWLRFRIWKVVANVSKQPAAIEYGGIGDSGFIWRTVRCHNSEDNNLNFFSLFRTSANTTNLSVHLYTRNRSFCFKMICSSLHKEYVWYVSNEKWKSRDSILNYVMGASSSFRFHHLQFIITIGDTLSMQLKTCR
jgi:hypothetical protein